MKASQAITRTLISNDIDVVFGVPGELSISLEEEIWTNTHVRYVMARKESAVTHQAWGYADSGGGIAATLVIRGPGDMNAVNGLFNALDDSIPMVHISVGVDPAARETGVIHEAPPNAYDEVVKENIDVSTNESLVPSLERAIDVARSQPPGPVRISIPDAFLDTEVELPTLVDFPQYSFPSQRDPDEASAELEAIVSAIESAERPLVLAGGGVKASQAGPELREFLEQYRIPVVSTRRAKGVVSEEKDYFVDTLLGFAQPALQTLFRESDLLIAMGTDLDSLLTSGGSLELPETIIHVTLGEESLGQLYEPDFAVVGDCRAVLTSLLTQLESVDVSSDLQHDGISQVHKEKQEIVEDLLEASDPPLYAVNVANALRKFAPSDTVFTSGISQSAAWIDKMMPVGPEAQYVAQGSWISMATALPAGIGAKLANPDRPVVALAGDGDHLMTIYELHTLIEQDIPLTVLVLNSQGYAAIADHAKRHADFNEFEWDHAPIRFTGIAESMDLDAVLVETQAELETQISEATDLSEPSLIEVPIESHDPRVELMQ